ncbi:calcium-binding protein [Paracoccus sp. IB05]|uniref:calcium-binding protein n=1 Tax=Paracoccus sp. IB05 TaxID=2779367 RepID=UPI0018E8451A|nr:calcium-binding protein [Paracoccus sp. IB05]MBJ2150683.1 hypothetical protein [Paracoccus sp. IB05]
MTLLVGVTSTGAGIRYDLTTLDDIVLGPGSLVVSTDSTAISGIGSNHDVRVAGMVHSGGAYGVYLGDQRDTDQSQTVIILPGGSVSAVTDFGSVGVWIMGVGSTLLNEGSISAFNGVAIGGIVSGVTGPSTITNRGTIYGKDDGITRFASDTETLIIHNTGLISGEVRAFNHNASNAVEIIRNRGEIVGEIAMGSMDDIVDNRGGSIDGNVDLGAGNDTFDNRGGTLNGVAYGGDGNDIVIGNNAQAEIFDGAAGLQDALDFRLGAGAHVALDGSYGNDGAALGDTYTGFEVIYGSNVGNDRLRGGAEVNSFLGNGGNDFLDGGAGNDALRGGTGTDTLMGGAGNDLFRFFFLNECGDLIVDFSSNTPGNNDSIQVSAAGFGGGLAAGVLAADQFQSRADNLAQDSNDRFIFRTTDTTLWFDADGNGGGAGILVADMQAWATMTAADILIL